MFTLKLSRRTSILVVLSIVLLSLPGRAAAQGTPSLPGQFAYVEDGSRLYLVRGNVDEPILIVQTAHGSTVANPRFSRDGRRLAYCIHDPDWVEYPVLYFLDTLTLEKDIVPSIGSCSYDWWLDGSTLFLSTPVFTENSSTEDQGIWSYTLETGALEVLVRTDSPVVGLRASPDGRTLSFFEYCFECVGSFYTYDLITGVKTEWSEETSDWHPGPGVDWSPDGKLLAFDQAFWMDVSEGATLGLGVASRDGESVREIHSMPGRAAHFPIWSRDGRRIAFASFESFAIGSYLNRRGDLMTVDADGSGPRRLYSSIFEIFPQAWSPDGRYLLFVEPLSVPQDRIQRQQLVLLEVVTGTPLWKMSSLAAITADWAPISDAGAAPEPSPPMAGKAGLLFVSTDYALAFYEPLSGQVQKLTAPFSGTEFSVSPDGNTILFGDQILTLQSQANGTVSAAAVASPHPSDFSSIRWSPDGRKYGFVDEDGSTWVVEVDGKRTQLTEGESPPGWSYDGSWMSFCDKKGRVWIAQAGKPADWIIQRERCQVKWSPTQAILAYVTYPSLNVEEFASGTAFLYDPINGRTREIARNVSEVDWSPDGRLVGIQRITWVGASNYGFSISVVNPETGDELLIEEFEAEMYGNQGWIEQADGYLVGSHRFQVDALSSVRAAEVLFDATQDGSRLLVGSNRPEGLEIGCRETGGERLYPLLNVTTLDTPGPALPGLHGRFSPDGQWILVSDFVEDRTVSWLGRCEDGAPLRLSKNARPFDLYFSPDSAWLVMEMTRPFREMISWIAVQDLESGSVKEVQAASNTDSAWLVMPGQPAASTEESLPTVSATPLRTDGPINLQSDVPSLSRRTMVLPLLLWAGALAAFMALAYFMWIRSGAGGGRHALVVQETQPAAMPSLVEEPAPKPTPEEVENAFRQGVEWVRGGRAEEGVSELQRVIAADPANEDAWFWLAIARVRTKAYRSAERCFLQAKKHGHPEADKALEWLRREKL